MDVTSAAVKGETHNDELEIDLLAADLDPLESMTLTHPENVEEKKPRGRGRPRRLAKNRSRGRLTLPRKATKRSYSYADPDYQVELQSESKTEGDLSCKMEMRTPEERKSVPPKILRVPASRRFSFSLEEKVKIIEELESGEKQADLCKRRGLPKSTVTSIWKNRDNVRRCVEQIGLDRKRLRGAQHAELESVILAWFKDLKAANSPINGSQVRARARIVAKELGEENFRASVGWLDKFKMRHKISFKKLCSKQGKRNSNGTGATNRKKALDWVKKVWPEQVEGYSAENIFTVQETGLFFRASPFKTALLRTETCSSGRMAGERLSVLLCVNSNGSEKLKPCVVGNDPIPRSFQGITTQSNLPVSYSSSSKAWINKAIFQDWLQQWNLKLEISNRKVILILNGIPCHSVNETEYPHVRIITLPNFFPKTSHPLERGVIAGFKRVYRRLLLEKLVRKSEHCNVSFRSISVLESLVLINSAWSQITPELVHNCFGLVGTVEEPKMEVFQQTNGDVKSLEELEADLDASVVLKLKLAGISFPDSISLKDYSHIDWSVQSTDITTDISDSGPTDDVQRSTRRKENGETQHFQGMPTKKDVQTSIDTIRNWAMFSKSECPEIVHTALSLIENFVINQHPEAADANEPEHSETENFVISHYEPSEAPEPESSEILQDSVSNHDHVIIFHPPGSVLIDCSNGEIDEPESDLVQAQLIHVPVNCVDF